MHQHLVKLFVTYLVGGAGGLLFSGLQLPLPWILGPLSMLILYKGIGNGSTEASLNLRKVSFALLGIQIGGTFTAATFQLVTPYLVPYTLLTLLLITISFYAAFLITKIIPIDLPTSLLSSVPGGLSTVLALSDSVQANTVMVTIFQTIRLITVLFVVPFTVIHLLFTGIPADQALANETIGTTGPLWTILVYPVAFIIALMAQGKIPAALVMIPMLLTAAFQVMDLVLFPLPDILFIFAQWTIGVYLGNSVSVKDLAKAGRYCLYYFGLSVLLIALSFLFGYFFSIFTELDLVTAVLSFAPGGLIEMALTAQSVSGDPSVVSSLQVIRLLTIVLLVPFLIKWLLRKQSASQ